VSVGDMKQNLTAMTTVMMTMTSLMTADIGATGCLGHMLLKFRRLLRYFAKKILIDVSNCVRRFSANFVIF